MNWKFPVLTVLLLSSLAQAAVQVEALFVENGRKVVEAEVVLTSDVQTVIEEAGVTITMTLNKQETEGALVGVLVTRDGVNLLDSELSVVWDNDAVVQTGDDYEFVKLVCKSRPVQQEDVVEAVQEFVVPQEENVVTIS